MGPKALLFFWVQPECEVMEIGMSRSPTIFCSSFFTFQLGYPKSTGSWFSIISWPYIYIYMYIYVYICIYIYILKYIISYTQPRQHCFADTKCRTVNPTWIPERSRLSTWRLWVEQQPWVWRSIWEASRNRNASTPCCCAGPARGGRRCGPQRSPRRICCWRSSRWVMIETHEFHERSFFEMWFLMIFLGFPFGFFWLFFFKYLFRMMVRKNNIFFQGFPPRHRGSSY